MTYNFDSERWFDNEMDALEAHFKKGEIDEAEFNAQKDRLIDQYEEMLKRLDIKVDYK